MKNHLRSGLAMLYVPCVFLFPTGASMQPTTFAGEEDLGNAIAVLEQAVVKRKAEIKNCPEGDLCPGEKEQKKVVRTLSAVEKILARARELHEVTKTTSAVKTSSAGVRKLSRFQEFVGEGVAAATNDLLDETFMVAQEREDEFGQVTAELCTTSSASKLDREATKVEGLFDLAIELKDGNEPSKALKSLGKVLGWYDSLIANGENLLEKSEVSSIFEPAPPENQCLEIEPIPEGAMLCYDTRSNLIIDLVGPVCYTFGTREEIRVEGILSASFLGDINLSGTIKTTSCTDPASFGRISKLTESFVLEVTDLGGAKVLLTMSADPPTVTPLGSILPVPPVATSLCVGDRLMQPEVRVREKLRGAGVSEGLRLINSIEHEVKAIETVTVPAGTFTAARIETTIVSAARRESITSTVTSWIADQVGQVRVEIREEGALIASQELLEVNLP